MLSFVSTMSHVVTRLLRGSANRSNSDYIIYISSFIYIYSIFNKIPTGDTGHEKTLTLHEIIYAVLLLFIFFVTSPLYLFFFADQCIGYIFFTYLRNGGMLYSICLSYSIM